MQEQHIELIIYFETEIKSELLIIIKKNNYLKFEHTVIVFNRRNKIIIPLI